jgi:hypothetical protein
MSLPFPDSIIRFGRTSGRWYTFPLEEGFAELARVNRAPRLFSESADAGPSPDDAAARYCCSDSKLTRHRDVTDTTEATLQKSSATIVFHAFRYWVV